MKKKFVILIVLALMPVGLLPTSAQETPFTLTVDSELQPAVSTLFRAWYNAEPAFVEAGGDVIATANRDQIPEGFVDVPPHFLPGAFFLTEVMDSTPIDEFINFAVSPDGQAVLIEGGFLPDSITITDQIGHEVTIPQPVRSVITPYSIATYLVYGVDAEDRLIAGGYLGARDPIGAERMEAIDPRFPELSAYVMTQREINIEEVANLDPDVIFTSSRSAWLDTISELGIPLVLFEGESPERLKESMLIAGQVFGPNAAAHANAWVSLYDRIYAQVVAVTEGVSADERPSVMLMGEEPTRVISGDMYQTDIIEAAGGQSVSNELTGFWNDVNLEQVVVWNPDVIVIVPYGNVTPETLTNSPEWQAVAAVQNGKVYKMPSWIAPWDSPVPDSVLGIIWLAQMLFEDGVGFDCATEAIGFFDIFYDYQLPEEEITALCGA